MENRILAYNYPWTSLKDEQWRRVLREYLDWGVDTFVFNCLMALDCIKDKSRLEFMRNLTKEMGVKFIAMHGLCDVGYDLNTTMPERRPDMIRDHIRAMEIDAEFGGKTYTVHIGAYHYTREHVPLAVLRPLAAQTLEQLVPVAEKLGLVIAVENNFEPTNVAKEVLALVEPLSSSPAIGVCYDTGHAQHMAPYPWKDPSKYAEYMSWCWWEGLVEEADALEKLQKHVVTTHIHDNSGYADQHGMPFDGTIEWDKLMPKLFACPRMLEFQTEVKFTDQPDWAGVTLAPKGGYSIKRQVETFRKLGF
ncbi:MAG: sugar phosphate isomerase/epimerase [Victivallales bacterium]|nr:sugar phosphate isomerase/epimerase [Victivallales bacterium]